MTKTVSLAFVGDLMLGRKISRALGERSPEWFWGDTLPVLRQADAVFGNLESPIAAGPLKRNKVKTFHFCADPAAVEILKVGNVRFVCLANNHTMDYGAEALSQTVTILDDAGIAHAGGGRNRAEAEAPAVVALDALKVGVIAATDNMRTFAARDDRGGANFVGTLISGRARGLEWIERSCAALRKDGADLIVFSFHWGPNMRGAPPSWFRRFAHEVIDRGVDIIHGHSAHIFQGIERYKNGLILYDTGDFIDDYWKFPLRETFWSYIFLLDVKRDGPSSLRLVPVENHFESHGSPARLATGETARRINQRMKLLCAALGTKATDTNEGLAIAGPVLARFQ
jgi:poly-gamma-glutamate capsule biosynthesis protein CapA/YwtB (metallophosphatase superfamily)